MTGPKRQGVAALYLIVLMVLLCGICSLAVDYGRVQISKTELRRACDAAARAGAASVAVGDPLQASTDARNFASRNLVDGSGLTLNPSDVQFGTWNSTGRTFTQLTGFAAANANSIRVLGARTRARGTAVPLLFAKVMGMNFCDVNAETIVMVVPAINVNKDVSGTSNPFLAGMPSGSVASMNNPHNSPDYAGTLLSPRQSPFPVNMPIIEGSALTFDSISGTVRHDPNLPFFSPDGELSDIGGNTNRSENGISDLIAPINALVGVFLDDNQPNTSAAPSRLDFRSAASRDFNTLNPQVKQLFFIGDGLNSSGAHQQFVVPRGATRLYLATWDFFEWNNNAGNRVVRVNRPMKIITVK